MLAMRLLPQLCYSLPVPTKTGKISTSVLKQLRLCRTCDQRQSWSCLNATRHFARLQFTEPGMLQAVFSTCKWLRRCSNMSYNRPGSSMSKSIRHYTLATVKRCPASLFKTDAKNVGICFTLCAGEAAPGLCSKEPYWWFIDEDRLSASWWSAFYNTWPQ